MGPFASFAVAFSMVSITTAIFFLLPSLFGTSGAAGEWLWLACGGRVFLVVPVCCFSGWEGAADLAEETNDPRSVTPRAMIRANLVSMAASVLMIVGFLI